MTLEHKIKNVDLKGCCCEKEPIHLVTYDSGDDHHDIWFVCQNHMQSEAWNLYIVKRVEIKT